MKILLANPRGFCAGVRMAIEVVDQVLRAKGPPLYVYHEIVHNKHVVEDFRSRGVSFVETVEEVPEGSVLIFSAHGVSPAVRASAAARNLQQVDATCPLVTKVHNEVIRYARDGYHIIFIGHPEHQEAVGTVGEAPASITVVDEPHEVEHLSFPPGTRLAYVTQTTLSVTDANRVIDALKAKFPEVKPPPKDDICYATTNRQEAVSLLAPEADLVLVVGVALDEVRPPQPQEAVLHLPRVRQLVDDEVLGALLERHADEDERAEVEAAEAAQAGDPEEPRRADDAHVADVDRPRVERQGVEPALGPGDELALAR